MSLPDRARPRGDCDYLIRPYQAADGQAVREICVRTCWMGDYRPECIIDAWTWAQFWTRYYTDTQPQHCWVAVHRDSRQVAGYLTGTPDARGEDRYQRRVLPGIVAHVLRRRLMRQAMPRAAAWAMVRSAVRGELACPPNVLRSYPATFHLDLLAQARGQGLGGRLVGVFLDQMRAAGVSGVHIRPMAINAALLALAKKHQFVLLDSRPLTAFAHVERRQIEIQTYGLRLGPT